MQHILVYGDSLSWGIMPLTRARLDFEQRWPGLMERALNAAGREVRVSEDCLNGRCTVWEDPFKPGRNALAGIAQRIESESPLALVMLMLGTNDFQSMHANNAWHAAQGIAALVDAIRTAPIEPGMPIPPVLVIAPPPITEPQGDIAPKFAGGAQKCSRLVEAYKQVCEQRHCHFFDAGTVVTASEKDGVHLDADAHERLGRALARAVDPILDSQAK